MDSRKASAGGCGGCAADTRCPSCGASEAGEVHAGLAWRASMLPAGLSDHWKLVALADEGVTLHERAAGRAEAGETELVLALAAATVGLSQAEEYSDFAARMSAPRTQPQTVRRGRRGETVPPVLTFPDSEHTHWLPPGGGIFFPAPHPDPEDTGKRECCCSAVDLVLKHKRLGTKTSPAGTVQWKTEVNVVAKTKIVGDPSAQMTDDGKCTLSWKEYHLGFSQADDNKMVVPTDKWITFTDPPWAFAILDPIRKPLDEMKCDAGTFESKPVADTPRLSSAPDLKTEGAVWGIVTLKSGGGDCKRTEIKRYFYALATLGTLVIFPPPPEGKPDDYGVDTTPAGEPPFTEPTGRDATRSRQPRPAVPKGARDVTLPKKELDK